MNEKVKLSKMAKNDLESVFIVVRSVAAKFGVPMMSRREIRGWTQIVPGLSSEYLRICIHFEDESYGLKTVFVRP